MHLYSTVICGVGGTGVIGFGMMLKNLGMPHGYTVVGSETRGSSQRGGAITASVRYITGDNDGAVSAYKSYFPPNIPVGKADLLIATEYSEVLRQAIYLNESTKILINNHSVVPVPDRKSIKREGGIGYPDIETVVADISKLAHSVNIVDASKTSFKQFGSYVMTNYILLGAAIQCTDLPIETDLLMEFLSDSQKKDAVLSGLEMVKKSEQ